MQDDFKVFHKSTNMRGTDIHTEFMHVALAEAKEAERQGEVPVGAVVVTQNGKFLAKAHNETIVRNDPTAHAEMEAIRDTSRRLGSRKLQGCTLYSSSPACPMCEAAAYWAGIERQVSGRQVYDAGRPQLCG